MLRYCHSEDDFTDHVVSSVDVRARYSEEGDKILGNFITIYGLSGNIITRLYVWGDANATLDTATRVLCSCVKHVLQLGFYRERDYLYLTLDNDEHCEKVSGREEFE